MNADQVSDAIIDRLLEAIERQELSSLRWGYVDGYLPESMVYALAESVLVESEVDIDTESLVEALIDLRLLFEFSLPSGEYGLRSRFAESVRLLRKNKQLLPHLSWLEASNLVSDYRVDARPRQIPRRRVSASEAIRSLHLPEGGLETKIAEAILRPEGKELKLSQFQVEAARRILENDGPSRGVVVSAGTGSGKTLAFYLPALIAICPWVDSGSYWTKVLSIYPRRELLKDQFGEAFRMVRQVERVLKANGRRSLRIGTFFGLTPIRCEVRAIEWAGWARVGGGFACPFLLCPSCGGQMYWSDGDITRGRERLTCANPSCNLVATEEQVTLTRQQATTKPPDIVFATMEMVHQRLCDTTQRVVLGLHPVRERRARIVLLDEIHTYEGTTGAQSGLALRRWCHVNGQSTRLVGLSATLREAPRFFSELTGLPEHRVAEVRPSEEDLEPHSMASQVILRGDPASQASLLSTSIQTSFLMARLLDPPGSQRSGGRYGHRVFVFTDDLDVTNRLFDSLRDAEAYDVFGRPDTERQPLASLRGSNRPDWNSRDLAGQRWSVCEEIGWSLDQRLRLSRTTSQDAGVDATSSVVVATSALEVGFDDPGVGAIVQHKSPHRLASFVQRRGRAGRTLRMRPWMVTVLSDYGRDRLTYQAYEQLFDPALPPQRLPVRNRYVLRMQAVFSFIEWLADEALTSGRKGWWWRTLNGPTDCGPEQEKQKWVQKVLKALLRQEGDCVERLTVYLGQALQIDRDGVSALLWDPPRSLMLEVIPTLARRLATAWELNPAIASGQGTDLLAKGKQVHPLPDFVPPNLFSDLNLPEVNIILPPATTRHEERTETLSIVQTLNRFAPGRVTRRFAFEHGALNHWIPVPVDARTYDLPIREFLEQYEHVADVTVAIDGRTQQVPCYRPWVIRPEKVSKQYVSPTSMSRLKWNSELAPTDEPVTFRMSSERGWGRHLRTVSFYLHTFRAVVTVRRFATEAIATIRRPGADNDLTVQTLFKADKHEPAAVGYEQDVDGMSVQIILPDPDTLTARATESRELPIWRTMYFRDLVLGDPLLESEANWFQRDWLRQIYLSALVATACRLETSLEEASKHLKEQDPSEAFGTVIETVFSIRDSSDEELPEGAASKGRLQQRLRDLLGRPLVLERLHALSVSLWNPERVAWGRWLRRRVHETLGEAVMLASLAIAPRHARIETLLLDLDRGVSGSGLDDNTAEIWITESTPGGTGVIESIAEAFAADERTIFTALEAALAPSDLELASTNLDAFIELACGDTEVSSATDRVRQHCDHAARNGARADLFRLLAKRGVGVHHAFSVALEHRLLRDGMDPAADQLVAELVVRWREYETRLGVAIGLRVFCYLVATDSVLGPRIVSWLSAMSGAELVVGEAVGVLAGILWPRPAEIRGRSLQSYTPFREQGRSDPSMVRDLLIGKEDLEIVFGRSSWRERLLLTLAEAGRVRLKALRQQEEPLHRELLSLIATPVDVGYLQFYPVIEQADRDGMTVSITLILREVAAT